MRFATRSKNNIKSHPHEEKWLFLFNEIITLGIIIFCYAGLVSHEQRYAFLANGKEILLERKEEINVYLLVRLLKRFIIYWLSAFIQ